jgi:hypothetical protein
VQYLEFYYHCAGPSLADKFDNEFWSRIALQMAHSEPAVRHALITVAYLNQQQTGSLKHAVSSNFTNSHGNKTPLLHYNKAMRFLVSRMMEPSYSPEVGLVTCLLFVCIEFLRADHHSAFTHLRNGLKIIADMQQRHHNDLPKQIPWAKLDSSIASEDMIENQITPLFVRGIASALMHGVNVEEDFPISYPLPESYPQSFANLREAQASSHTLWNGNLLYLRQVAINVHRKIPRSENDAKLRHQMLRNHSAWYRAFEGLESSLKLAGKFTPEDTITFSSLKTTYWGSHILTHCVEDLRQMAFDAYLPEYKKLLHYARIALDPITKAQAGSSPPAAAANFTFEIALLPALQLTAKTCRCPTTRREAVRLLSLNPPREGLWDPEQHAAVAKRVIEIEEMKVDEKGWPLEETRIWRTIIDPNMDRNGGFWVTFCPARWIGHVDEKGQQKLIREWFTLGEPNTDTLADQPDPLKVPFKPETDPLR